MKRIGVVTIWFERGQSYASLNVIAALQQKWEVFVMARMGFIGSSAMLSQNGEFSFPNLSTYPNYDIPTDVFKFWIRKNQLEAVVLVEEQWQKGLLQAAKEVGCKTIGLPMQEFVFDATGYEAFKDYDVVMAPTRFTYDRLVKLGLKNVVHTPWGHQLEFKLDQLSVEPPVRFFHPAGWGGMHARKNTQAVVSAFEGIQDRVDARLLVHMQTVDERKKGKSPDGKLRVEYGTLDRSEILNFYKFGHVAVLPSKWEGIGLTLVEAVCNALVLITVDAPPMNEYVVDGETGFLIPVSELKNYSNVGVKGAEVDVGLLAKKMEWCANNPEKLKEMRLSTARFAMNRWDWAQNQHYIIKAVAGTEVS